MAIPNQLPDEAYRPLRRAEYDRLVTLGVFDDERIELLHGRLVHMSPQGTRHSVAVMLLNHIFVKAVGSDLRVRPQLPFAAADDSEPEPDLAVVPVGDQVTDHPSRASLVIEVSDSSLAKDRVKARLYAAAGVPEFWIVNLIDDLVEVYSDPVGERYSRVEPQRPGELLAPRCLVGLEIPVAEVIPPRP